MFKLWNLASRADLFDRRELLRVGGLTLAGLSLPALLKAGRQAVGEPGESQLRQGEELHHPLSFRRPVPARHLRSEARRRRGHSRRIQHDPDRVDRRAFLRAGAAHRPVDEQDRPGADDESHAQRSWPRVVLDVHGVSISRFGARREFDEPGGHAAHGLDGGEAGAGERADVSVRDCAAPHGRRRRPTRGAIRGLAGRRASIRC